MEPLIYFLLLILSYSGLFVGLILSRVAFEELESGKKYFLIIQFLLWIIITNLIIFYYNDLLFVIIGALLVILMFILKFVLQNKSYHIDYLVLGILFYYSSGYTNLMLINSTAIFLYGFFTASLIVLNSEINNNKDVFNKKIINKILLNIGIIIIASILFILL
ncbi:MAG: hypothetical protein QXG00_05475 [Candidatus Woesearchaeota archaeon]